MHDEQNNQSVKDILEDIKKAISGKNTNNSKIEMSDHEEHEEDDDILHLKEEYSQDEIDDDDEEYVDGEDYVDDEYSSHDEPQTSHISESQDSDNLIMKENIEEIKVLLGKMQSQLRQQQQPKPSLTVEELVMPLLRPALSEWLNNHLYKLVKEVVEKELRDIINNK